MHQDMDFPVEATLCGRPILERPQRIVLTKAD